MLRKWSWRSGAITQVCWSFHLHIKCYLVSYGAQVGGGGEPGAGHCCPEADGTTWLKTQILASGPTAGYKLTDGHFLGGADR